VKARSNVRRQVLEGSGMRAANVPGLNMNRNII